MQLVLKNNEKLRHQQWLIKITMMSSTIYMSLENTMTKEYTYNLCTFYMYEYIFFVNIDNLFLYYLIFNVINIFYFNLFIDTWLIIRL